MYRKVPSARQASAGRTGVLLPNHDNPVYNDPVSDETKLTLRCPDCDSHLVVDAATGEVLFHRKAKEPIAGGKDFDALLSGLDEQKEQAENIFSREMEAIKDRDRLLEDKFKEAMKRAAEDPDDAPPPRPFDLD